jgi:hypothetical protein
MTSRQSTPGRSRRTSQNAEINTLRSEMTRLRGEVRTELARLDDSLERLRSLFETMENRLLLRLPGAMIALFGLSFAALHA